MTHWLNALKKGLLATVSVMSFGAGIITVISCAGEGGPVGGGGNGGGGFNPTAEFRALWPAAQTGATFVGSDRCGDCHGTRVDHNVWNQWMETRHAQVNVGCESCHGPGSVHANAPSPENILTMPKVTKDVVCGQCHGPINDQWRQSGHWKIIQSPVHEAATNPANYGRNSRCIACHSGLTRIEVDKGVNLGSLTDEQIRELSEETLNDVPHIATCATCHNPHAKTGNLSDDGKEVQLRHPVFNTDITPVDPGSPAAETTTFNHLCAQCHNGRGANPADTALNSGTARPNMHDSNQYNMLMGFGGVEGSGPVIRNTAHALAPGQCSTCHMPDSRHTFTVSFDKGCQPCHTAADAAARTTSVKSEIISQLYALRVRLANWATDTFPSTRTGYTGISSGLRPFLWEYSTNITAAAQELGIDTTVASNLPPSNHQSANVPIEIKRARHNYYFVLRDACFGPHNAPYSKHLIQVANDNLDALGARSVSVGSQTRALDTNAKRNILLGDLNRWRSTEHESGE